MRAGRNPASDNSQRSATPPRPPPAAPTPVPALIRSTCTAYTAVVDGRMRESRSRCPYRTLPGIPTKCDGIRLPRCGGADFACNSLRGRHRLRGFVDCAAEDEPRRGGDCGGPEVGEEVSEPREVAKYAPLAGEEERPPDLDRIDASVDRFRNGDRRSRVDEVGGEDQSSVEAHRGREEGLR